MSKSQKEVHTEEHTIKDQKYKKEGEQARARKKYAKPNKERIKENAR